MTFVDSSWVDKALSLKDPVKFPFNFMHFTCMLSLRKKGKKEQKQMLFCSSTSGSPAE